MHYYFFRDKLISSKEETTMEDVIIIGAGVIGSFIAHDLCKYQLSIHVIEKEDDVGNVTSMAIPVMTHFLIVKKPIITSKEMKCIPKSPRT